jgi:hypothetical protein
MVTHREAPERLPAARLCTNRYMLDSTGIRLWSRCEALVRRARGHYLIDAPGASPMNEETPEACLARLDGAVADLRVLSGLRLGLSQKTWLAEARRALAAHLHAHADQDPPETDPGSMHVLISANRRSGKSTLLALLAAAVLVSQRRGHVRAVLITGRQCMQWLSLVQRFLNVCQYHPLWAWHAVSADKRDFIQIHNGFGGIGGTVRVSALAASSGTQNMRGGACMLEIVDEYALMLPEILDALRTQWPVTGAASVWMRSLPLHAPGQSADPETEAAVDREDMPSSAVDT